MIDFKAPKNELIKQMLQLQKELDDTRWEWLKAYEEANRQKMRDVETLRALVYRSPSSIDTNTPLL